MHTLSVGIPAAVILLTIGVASFERYSKYMISKRNQQLKRWVTSHYSGTP